MWRWRKVAVGLAVLVVTLSTMMSARAATLGSRPRPVRGLDVSSYQHIGRTINWRLLGREGMKFAAIKVSEGTYYTNPYYASDARAAAAAGLSVMPYVFANPHQAPGGVTARFGIAAAHYVRGRSKLPLEVDLENDPYTRSEHVNACYGMTVRQMVSWITVFVRVTAALTGKAPIIYTMTPWWRKCTGGTTKFRTEPLWLASYDTTKPGIPSAWQRWTFWQYDNNGKVPGVGLTDLDFYQATSALPALRPAPAKPKKHKAAPAKPKKRKPAPTRRKATPKPRPPRKRK
jgi:GH25 family lysozyme M1 (1,4-beta-N-acetylmuramidase)